MKTATFLVSKHPFGTHQDGETAVTRLLLDAAAESCAVRVIALADEPAASGRFDVVEVPKPPARLARLAIAAALRRRSLIHARFAPRALREEIERTSTDTFVARRAYMAEAAVAAGAGDGGTRLTVLVDVLESTVMRLRRSPIRPLLALEARRTRRDELRCIGEASDLAFFSDTEVRDVGEEAGGPWPRLDLVLPPAAAPAALEEPVALFVGDRRWPPNAEALEGLMALWPRIHDAVPAARLLIAGRPGSRERPQADPSVESLGFLDDLAGLWRRAAVLLAPVSIGGGVRVKVLDAARHGVPVAGTAEAIGSAGGYLPLEGLESEQALVADAIALLADPAERRRRGAALYEANRELSARGFVEEQVAALLSG